MEVPKPVPLGPPSTTGIHPPGPARATQITPTLGRDHSPREELVHLTRVVRGYRRHPALILDSTSGAAHPDLMPLVVGSILPYRRRPVVVLMGAMWEPDRGWRGSVQRWLVRRADRCIMLYAVQTSEELRVFPTTWGVAPDKVRQVPYFFTLTIDELRDPEPSESAPEDRDVPALPTVPYIFAGGDSHRDYEPLIVAARALPEHPFVIATRLLRDRDDLPANLTAGPLSRAGFMAALRHAAAVVVPILPGLHRAAGQQTYLNAMLLGKPTIVSDEFGVRDHVRDGETALVVSGSADSYRDALAWVLAPGNREAVASLGAAAHHDVAERFTFERHADAVLAVLDEALRERATGAG